MPQSPVNTAMRPQDTVGSPGAEGNVPDPLAPLRSMPELNLGTLREQAPAETAERRPGDDRGGRVAHTRRTTPKINSHIHLPPNFSAFETVEQAVDLAADAGLCALGTSNYYDFDVYACFAQASRARGIFPLFGAEIISLVEELRAAGVRINDPDNPGRMYLCGKGITAFAPMAPVALALMQPIRDADSARMQTMVERMGALMTDNGVSAAVSVESIRAAVARRHGVAPSTVYLQERHVAQAFQEAIFAHVAPPARSAMLRRLLGVGCADDAIAVQVQLRSQLMKAGRPAYVEESCLDADTAYALVLALGGVPCYPILADGASPVCEFEASADELAAELTDRGIWCAEFIPSRNSAEIVERYASTLRGAGIIVLAGTEHNTVELVEMTVGCADGTALPDRVAGLFWEGTCVVAAHQYLAARERGGYVDARGRLNPDFATHEQRIAAFAGLGASVIEEFRAAAGGSAAGEAAADEARIVRL